MIHRRLFPSASGRRAPLFALLGLALLSWGGCREGEGKRPNVLIVLVDTLRADHMSTYGYPRPTTPNIDALATEAVVFTNHRAQATCTFPSVPSLLSSRYPFEFVATRSDPNQPSRGPLPPGTTIFPETMPYLPRILAEEGYFTAAVSASPIIRKTPSKYNKSGGFDPGFEEFIEVVPWSRAAAVNRAVENRLLGRLREGRDDGRPFFLYLHYTDPHDRYAPPERFFAGTYTGENDFVDAGKVNRIFTWEDPWEHLTGADVEHLVDLYDDEIRYLDRELARLLELLRAEDLWEDTLVILVSDHGEEILDHDYIKHCRPPPFDTVVSTPLIIRVPGSGAAGVRDQLTANLDVVPTVLDYLGIDAGAYDLDGHSLRRSIETGASGERSVFGSQFHYRFVATREHKLIVSLEDGSVRLFDLEADPTEHESLDDPAVRESLLARLAEWRAEIEGDVAQGEILQMERDLERALEAVGYIQ